MQLVNKFYHTLDASHITAIFKKVDNNMICGKEKKRWPKIRVTPNLAFSTMPFHKISRDLKLAAVRLYEGNHLPLDNILDCLRMSKSTFYHVLSLWNTTGDIVRHIFSIHGRPWILHFDDVDYLKRLIKARPDWFLDELLLLLETNRFISAHYTTIHRELVRANVSTKKLKWSQRKEMRAYRWTSFNAWPNMNLNNSAFWMNIQRMRGPLAGDVDDWGKACMLWRKVYSFTGDVFLLKDYSH